jgi:hypothetical protein
MAGVALCVGCASPGNGPTLAVTGSTQYVTDNGIVTVPRDFTGSTFTVVDPTVDSSQWYSKTGGPEPVDVRLPAGADQWVVQWQGSGATAPEYFAGTGGTLDLSYVGLGRPDAVFTSNAMVMLDATGLAPWASGDQIEVVNSSAGAVEFYPTSVEAEPGLLPGATTTDGTEVDWSGGEVDASEDGATLVYQLALTTTGSYAAIATLASVGDFTMVGAGTVVLEPSLMDVTADEMLTATFQRSAFEALRTDLGPNVRATTAATWSLLVDALPAAALSGAREMSTPDLVIDSSPAATTDLSVDYSYSNPLATGGVPWSEYVIAYYSVVVPNPAIQLTFYDEITVGLPIDMVRTSGVIAPVVSAPTGLQINGEDGYASADSVGATPTLTWQPPSVGTASGYEIFVTAFDANEVRLGYVLVAYTAETSFEIPDGLLVAGESNVAQVTAISSPGYSVTTPFIEPLPDGRATTTTGAFTR